MLDITVMSTTLAQGQGYSSHLVKGQLRIGRELRVLWHNNNLWNNFCFISLLQVYSKHPCCLLFSVYKTSLINWSFFSVHAELLISKKLQSTSLGPEIKSDAFALSFVSPGKPYNMHNTMRLEVTGQNGDNNRSKQHSKVVHLKLQVNDGYPSF